jgi:hypothetical protein
MIRYKCFVCNAECIHPNNTGKINYLWEWTKVCSKECFMDIWIELEDERAKLRLRVSR